MLHVDAEQLLVFELIERSPALIVGAGADHLFFERQRQLLTGSDEWCATVVAQDRQEVGVLPAHKILPEIVAGAEQFGQQW